MFKSPFIVIVIALFILPLSFVKAQSKKNKQLFQFSGMVLEKHALHPVPFTAIIIKGTAHGTICDYSGYYSFVAQPGDTVLFSSVGYRISPYVILDTLSTD